MKMNIYNISIVLLLLVVAAPAQSYFNLLLPATKTAVSTKAVGLGMTGVASVTGYGNLWTNPALLAGGESRGLLSVAGSLERYEEQRSFPVFDMFDDVVTDNIYVSNRYWYNDLSGGLTLNLPLGITAGLARNTFWDFRYDYLEEVRGSLPSGTYNRDPLVGYHEIHRTGRISATSLGLSFAPLAIVSVGLSTHFLSGHDLSDLTHIRVLQTDDALAADGDTLYRSELELTGQSLIFNFGFAVQPITQLRLGFNYCSGVDLTINGFRSLPVIAERTQLPGYLIADSSTTLNISLPSTFVVGLETRLTNPIATKAVVELHFTDWSDFKLEYDPAPDTLATLPHHFESSWELHAGIEHILLESIPVRFGFIFAKSPLGQEFESTRITVGGSYNLGPAVLDVAAVFGSIGYRYEDIFPAGGVVPDELETVRESRTTVNITLSIPF